VRELHLLRLDREFFLRDYVAQLEPQKTLTPQDKVELKKARVSSHIGDA